jgi:hypothetical protein
MIWLALVWAALGVLGVLFFMGASRTMSLTLNDLLVRVVERDFFVDIDGTPDGDKVTTHSATFADLVEVLRAQGAEVSPTWIMRDSEYSDAQYHAVVVQDRGTYLVLKVDV